jgi:hypothetical protein
MRIADLLREIDRSSGAATVADLAARLGATGAEIRSGLAALRAAGRLGPERGHVPGSAECAATGTCAMSCPGPNACPFVVDLGGSLEIRRG